MSDEAWTVCGKTGQARRTGGSVEVYVCWREPNHDGDHHGPLMGREPGPEEAFMSWEAHERSAGAASEPLEVCQCGHTRLEHESRYDALGHCTHRCLPPWKRPFPTDGEDR